LGGEDGGASGGVGGITPAVSWLGCGFTGGEGGLIPLLSLELILTLLFF